MNASNPECDLCLELNEGQGLFGARYGHIASSRIVAESANFVLIPTLGQLFARYLLVLPKFHSERFADLASSFSNEWISLIDLYCNYLQGPNIVFEHGARKATGGACGVYHAHIHIVPLPRKLSNEEIFNSAYDHCGQWRRLSRFAQIYNFRDCAEYICIRDSFGEVAAVARKSTTEPFFPSQFIRKRMVQIFCLPQHWDWRLSPPIEQKVLDTIADLSTHWRAHDHALPF